MTEEKVGVAHFPQFARRVELDVVANGFELARVERKNEVIVARPAPVGANETGAIPRTPRWANGTGEIPRAPRRNRFVLGYACAAAQRAAAMSFIARQFRRKACAAAGLRRISSDEIAGVS